MDSLVARLLSLRTEVSTGITFVMNGDQDKFVSYGELCNNAIATLGGLQKRGIKPGSEVILLIDDAETFLAFFWACLLGRMVPVPLSAGKQAEHLRKIENVSQSLDSPLIISDTSGLTPAAIACSEVERVVIPFPESYPEEKDLAFIQYSSGSTNLPKGVRLSHGNILYNAGDIIKGSRTSLADSSLCWMPLTHDMGLIGFHITSMIAGIQQYIIPTSMFIRRPAVWLERAARYKVTQLYSPNFGLQYMMSAQRRNAIAGMDLSAVRIIYNGAEPVSWKTCKEFLDTFAAYRLGAHVMLPVYGLAEASVAVTIPPPGEDAVKLFHLNRQHLNVGDAIQELPEGEDSFSFVGVGQALAHCAVRICAGSDEVLPENVIGHIQIRGGNVTAGYYRNEIATETVFTADGWLRTGDLGFMRDGMLIVSGREKHIYIFNGQNYYYHDIEQIAERVSALGAGRFAACGAEQQQGGTVLLVFVVFKEAIEQFIPVADLIAEGIYTQLGISDIKVLPIKRIPRTTSGKIQYFRLIQSWQNGEFSDEEAAIDSCRQLSLAQSSGSTDEVVINLLQTILGETVSYDDNIFRLGLNSLHAIRIASDLSALLNISLEVNDLFNYPVVSDLLQYIQQLAAAGSSSTSIVNEEVGTYQVSYAQRRFFIMQNNPGLAGALKIRAAYKLEGALSIEALQYSFERLTQCFGALRTVFYIRDNEVWRQVRASGNTVLHVNSMSYNDGDEASYLSRLLELSDSRDFDLENGPLFFADLARIAADRYVLLLTAHHIILDGWSLPVIERELARGYQEYFSGEKTGAATQCYSDFVAEQQSLPADSLTYWSNELSGELPDIELPFFMNHASVGEACFDIKTISLPKAALVAFCAKRDATLYMAITALLHALLFRYTGRHDIITGTNVAGRWKREWLNDAGLYTNTLPVRCSLDGHDSFEVLLEKIKQQLLSGFRHQQVPLEWMLDRLSVDNITPQLFNVLLLYQHYDPSPYLSLPGIDIALFDPTLLNPQGFVDLQFEATETAAAIQVTLKYRKDLYGEHNIVRLLAYFQYLAATVVKTPSLPLQQYSRLSDEEEYRIIHDFNDTRRAYSFQTVIDLFDHAVKKYPQQVAIKDNDIVLKYNELDEKVSSTAACLAKQVPAIKGSRIAIMMDRSADCVVMIFSVLKAGAVYVPVNPEWPDSRIRFILEDAAIDLLVTQGDYLDRVHTMGCPYWLYDEQDLLFGERQANVSLPAAAYIMYTSGTTGAPKGVVITHTSLCDYVQTFIEHFSIDKDDKVIHQSALTFDLSVEELFPILCMGGCLVVSRGSGADVHSLTNMIEREGITVLSTTPPVIAIMNQSGNAYNSLRLLISGGEPLKAGYFDKLPGRIKIFNSYGPTETTVCATYHEVKGPEDLHIIGRPIANRSVYICNEQLELLPPGVKGEILIGGMGTATGYLNQPLLSAEKFIKSPFGDNDILYRTGDVGYWLEDGRIGLVGRKDKQLKIQGYRIEPEEVESYLCGYPGLEAAIVLHKEGDNRQQFLLAFFISQHDIKEEDLRQYMLALLPRQVVPARFIQVPHFPVNFSGKTDHTALLSLLTERNEADAPSAGTVDSKLAGIWGQFLKKRPIGEHDNFFEMGGDSLIGVQIIARINIEYGIRLDVGELFRRPTMAALSAAVRAAKKQMYPSIPVVPLAAQYELSMAQKGLWMLHKLETNTAAYNIFGVYELKGRLDLDRLKASFARIIERHDSLRTSFTEIQGEPQQIVHPQGLMPMQYYDLHYEGVKAAIIEKIIANERWKEIDPASHPLARTGIIQVDKDSALLVLSMHHLIADGLSAAIIASEFFAIYQALEKGEAPMPALPAVQYKEYVYWEKQLLQEQMVNDSREFWLSYLKDAPPMLHFNYDFTPPLHKTYTGATAYFSISATSLILLERIGEKAGTTLFSTLLALLNIHLYKISGESDIVITSPFGVRSHPEFERQVGLFVNALLFRNKVDDQFTFMEMLAHVKDTTADVLKHKEFPFELLMTELLGAQRGVNVRMLFDDAEIQMNDFETTIKITEQLSFRQYQHHAGASIHDLTYIFSRKNGLRIAIEYNTSLFNAASIQIFGLKLEALIAAVCLNADINIADIDLRFDFEKETDSKVEDFFSETELF